MTTAEDEAWLGPEPDARVSEELAQLGTALREVVARTVELRPQPGELEPALATARLLAEQLAALPSRHAPAAGDVVRQYDPNRFNPISGTSNPVAAPLQMRKVTEGADGPTDGPAGRRTDGRVRFGPAYEGPPGHVHGGVVTAMYDELLGRSQLVGGFTGSITITFRKPTPLHRDLDVCAWVDRVEGRKRWVKGTCHLDGMLLTEAEGLFVAPRQGASIAGIAAALAGADVVEAAMDHPVGG